MLSDDSSSSDSETGRFKGQTKTEEAKGSNRKFDNLSSSGRNRPSENDKFRRDADRRRNERDSFNYSRDKQRYSRHSPVSRRRHSRNRSPRRSRDRNRRRNSRDRSRDRDRRHSTSKERRHRSRSKDPKDRDVRSRSHKSAERSRPHRSSDNKRDLKDEIRKTIEPKNSETKYDRKSREKTSTSPELGKKQSEVYKPPPSNRKVESPKRSESPVAVEPDSDHAEEVQSGSYYSMIPAIVKEKNNIIEKSEESSEIDSSDDERLRAKLLNLEKELQKTKKKKHHKKKHKRRSSKTRKEKDDANTSVEVTSTTDIQDVVDVSGNQTDAVPEVSSTQKGQKETSEEGEISSDNDNQEIDYEPSDLRHKLRLRTKTATNPDVCGPALPPHLENRFKRSASVEIEGPMLPPHLQPTKHIGPSIPNEMRKVLAEKDCEIIEEQSSDEDVGIGPLPAGAEDKWSDAHQRLEERALDYKIKKLDGQSLDSQKIKTREEWMLELPEGKAKIMGLEARSFRAKEGPDMSDRSSWTDTPEEKAKKAAGIVKEEDADEVMRREARAKQIADRDDEQEDAVKKHKKKHKRDESLLEIHQKKIKKKKKKEEKEDGKKERRPFSRDVDLQVNRFDEAQKKSIIKKAQGLNTRFSQGEAKFL